MKKDHTGDFSLMWSYQFIDKVWLFYGVVSANTSIPTPRATEIL